MGKTLLAFNCISKEQWESVLKTLFRMGWKWRGGGQDFHYQYFLEDDHKILVLDSGRAKKIGCSRPRLFFKREPESLLLSVTTKNLKNIKAWIILAKLL